MQYSNHLHSFDINQIRLKTSDHLTFYQVIRKAHQALFCHIQFINILAPILQRTC